MLEVRIPNYHTYVSPLLIFPFIWLLSPKRSSVPRFLTANYLILTLQFLLEVIEISKRQTRNWENVYNATILDLSDVSSEGPVVDIIGIKATKASKTWHFVVVYFPTQLNSNKYDTIYEYLSNTTHF